MDRTRSLERLTTSNQTNFSHVAADEALLALANQDQAWTRLNSFVAPRIGGRRSGFTLIEILIVLGIIVLVLSLGLPAVNRITGQKLNSTARQFVGLLRTIRTDAILLNNIYRLSINLEKNTYVVEAQKKQELLNENEAPAKKSKKARKPGKDDKPDNNEPPPSNFASVEKYNKEPKPLPSGLVFEGVLKEKEGLIEEGPAYIYFFPSGFNEQAIIYLNKEGATNDGYSLLLRATAGRIEIIKKYIKDFN